MYISYNVYLWSPPILTPEQEIEIGRQIILEGREAFLKRAPYLSEKDRQRAEAAKHYTPKQKIILGVVFAAIVVPAIVFFWLPMLLLIVPVLIYSGGSLLYARSRYHRWVDEMIAKYAASTARELREPTYAKSRP